jgi:hypothetical protein
MNKKFIPVALVVVLVLAGVALWLGLRGNEGARRANADITVFAPEGTQVIVMEESEVEEGEEEAATSESGDPELFVVPASGELWLSLDNGTYRLLANRGDEYYPWLKEITVTGLFSTEVHPFFTAKEPTLEEATDETALEAFATVATLPTAETPRLNADETGELYVSGNTVFVNWTGEINDMPEFICPGTKVEDCQLQPFYTFSTPVENIEFYGESDELLMADLGQAIVVVELDRRGTQNFQPLYVGTSPVAFRLVDGDVYITEGGVVSKVLAN